MNNVWINAWQALQPAVDLAREGEDKELLQQLLDARIALWHAAHPVTQDASAS